jgi:hypothetical protein
VTSGQAPADGPVEIPDEADEERKRSGRGSGSRSAPGLECARKKRGGGGAGGGLNKKDDKKCRITNAFLTRT